MDQLSLLKELLGNPSQSDAVLQFYLDDAKNIICEIRNTNYVEAEYETIQIKIAIEMFAKRGAQGQLTHSENGIYRSYKSGDISEDLLAQITPRVKTPYTSVITEV